jgi:hypothetical protein
MLGVVTSSRPGGAPHEELSLQPLPQYTLPTDGVIMCCVASTASGRIFLGGADGHVYEAQYSARDTWLSKRVAKVRRGVCVWWACVLGARVLRACGVRVCWGRALGW